MSEDGGEDARLSVAGSAPATVPHSGNGTLTGGGVRKIYRKQMSLSELVAKSEYRVALALLICLAVNVTVLTMHAIMHSRVHSTLIDDIRLVRPEVERQAIISEVYHSGTEVPVRRRRETNRDETTTVSISTSTSTSTIANTMEETQSKFTSFILTSSSEPSLIFTKTTTTTSSAIIGTVTSTTTALKNHESTSISSSTSIAFETTAFSMELITVENQKEDHDNDKSSGLTVDELDYYEHILQTTYNTLTTFSLLNAALLAAAVNSLYLNYVRVFAKRSPAVRIALKAFMLIALIFLFVELIYLIHPLLYSSLRLRNIVDVLFASDTWPQSREFMRAIQEHFVCTFPFESLKSEYTPVCEDDCSAKLKDHLMPVYAVVILILSAFIPFVVIGVTWMWNVYAKDRPEVRRVRDRFANTTAGHRVWRESSGPSHHVIETVRSTDS